MTETDTQGVPSLVERLREDHNSIWQPLMDEAADALARAQTALEPFADTARRYDDQNWADSFHPFHSHPMGAYRHARTVIETLSGSTSLEAVHRGGRVRIKSLEWRDICREYRDGTGAEVAQAWVELIAPLQYLIQRERDGTFVAAANNFCEFGHPTIEAAKAAAQADFEQRISAALEEES